MIFDKTYVKEKKNVKIEKLMCFYILETTPINHFRKYFVQLSYIKDKRLKLEAFEQIKNKQNFFFFRFSAFLFRSVSWKNKKKTFFFYFIS